MALYEKKIFLNIFWLLPIFSNARQTLCQKNLIFFVSLLYFVSFSVADVLTSKGHFFWNKLITKVCFGPKNLVFNCLCIILPCPDTLGGGDNLTIHAQIKSAPSHTALVLCPCTLPSYSCTLGWWGNLNNTCYNQTCLNLHFPTLVPLSCALPPLCPRAMYSHPVLEPNQPPGETFNTWYFVQCPGNSLNFFFGKIKNSTITKFTVNESICCIQVLRDSFSISYLTLEVALGSNLRVSGRSHLTDSTGDMVSHHILIRLYLSTPKLSKSILAPTVFPSVRLLHCMIEEIIFIK